MKLDPQVLAAVLPGCEKLELVEGSYLGEIKVKVGPIQGKFAGKVDLLDLDAPRSYRMVIDGRGAQGFVKATAAIALAPEGAGTKITYTSEAQVGGKVASVGQRLVETSARAIVKQSLEGLHDNIKIRVAAYKAHAAAKPVEAPPPVVEAPSPPPVAEEAKAVVVEPVAAIAVEPTPVAVVEDAKPPVIEYKRADASKMASAVAKEVTKTLLPFILILAAVIAGLVYIMVR